MDRVKAKYTCQLCDLEFLNLYEGYDYTYNGESVLVCGACRHRAIVQAVITRRNTPK